MEKKIKRGLVVIFASLSLINIPNLSLQSKGEKGLDQCTAIVADGSATLDGRVLIAKNKDLGANDCQILDMKKREEYPSNSKVRCDYIEIPQAPITYGWIGMKLPSQWGVGMGVNEFGVAITINAVQSKERFKGEGGLSTPDICRLGLERARNSEEAVELMGNLIEKYGQRVEGAPTITGQIYIIADPKESWILESTVYHWCAIRVNGVEARANQFQITTNWDLGSEDLVDYAIKQGWGRSKEEFNFALVYSERWPVESSQIRWERASNLLEMKKGSLELSDFMEIMRDHYEGTELYNYPPHESSHRTICIDRTGSSMMAQLRKDFPELSTVWIALSSPCTSIYLPLWVSIEEVPREWVSGGSNSAWWLFESLQREVDKDYGKRQQIVRVEFNRFEKNWEREVLKLGKKATELNKAGKEKEASALLSGFNKRCVAEAIKIASALKEEFEESNIKALKTCEEQERCWE